MTNQNILAVFSMGAMGNPGAVSFSKSPSEYVGHKHWLLRIYVRGQLEEK